MNKIILKTLLCAVMAAPMLTSCELDQMPYGSLPSEDTWQNKTQLDRHYGGMKAMLRSVCGGATDYMKDLQSDLFNQVSGATAYSKMYNWTFTGNQFEGDAIWSGNYSMIAEANDVLAHTSKFIPATCPTENDSIMTALVAMQAETAAHFAKAYGYMNMVTRYCKDYEPDGSATEPESGLPLVDKVDVAAKPKRATLEETYQAILDEISKAETLQMEIENWSGRFKDNPLTPGVNEALQLASAFTASYQQKDDPTYFVLYALRTRVWLYMHKFDEAISLSRDLIDSGEASLTPAASYLATYIYDDPVEDWYMPILTPEERTSSYSLFCSYDIRYDEKAQSAYLKGYSPSFIPTQGLFDLFEDGDVRKTMYFADKFFTSSPTFYGNIVASTGVEGQGIGFFKWQGNPNLWKTQAEMQSVIVNAPHPFRIAEQYLIIAEAALRKPVRDEALARTYLSRLRTMRYNASQPSSVSNLTGEALDKAVEEEWIREFAGEGYRLDALKRLHKGFKRMAPQTFSTPLLINTTGTQDLVVTADNQRFVWEIPTNDLQTNRNLKPNWK